MSALRLAFAALAVLACSGRALAFKNLQACDIVMFASGAARMEIAPQAWQAYRDETLVALSAAPGGGDANATQAMADRVIEAQEHLLAPVAGSDAYKDYLASGSCLVLKSLAVEGSRRRWPRPIPRRRRRPCKTRARSPTQRACRSI